MWVRDNATAYINLDRIAGLGLAQVSGTWYIDAYLDPSTIFARLSGSWATEAAAMEAIRELVHGEDPATYGD